MRRFALAGAVLLALVGAALAVAKGVDFSTKSVTATFTATTVSDLHSTTCTTPDGSFTDTKARYKGDAVSSESTLNGPITLNLHSLINTSKDLGIVSGDLSIGTGGHGHTHAHLTAVYSAGALAGLASGHVGPRVGLLGNLSASFNPTTGLTNGKVGASSGGAAVETTPGRCGPHGPGHHGPTHHAPTHHGPTGPHGPSGPTGHHSINVHGTVSALTTDKITVGSVQCNIPLNLQASVASHVKLGDQVDMKCSSSGGTNTLTRVEVKHPKK